VNSEVDGVSRVEDSDFGFLGGGLALMGFALAKIDDGLGQLPERVVESSVELRRVVNTGCLCGVRRLCIWRQTNVGGRARDDAGEERECDDESARRNGTRVC
jgi:hypothetical protein